MADTQVSCSKGIEECLTCEKAPCPLLMQVLDKYQKENSQGLEFESSGELKPGPDSEGELNPGEKPPYKKGAEDPRNRLNHLSGEEWLYFTKTIITTAYPSAYGHDLRKEHGANKPPQLMQELIEFFTKGDGIVMDPFAGVGGTLLGASLCSPPRTAVGIEINPRWVEIYNQVLEQHPELQQGKIHVGDCRKLMGDMPANSVDFVATDPPYNLQLKRTMCTGKASPFTNRHTDYNMVSHEDGDIANSGSYEEYLTAMGEVFTQCYRVLKSGGYMVVILRNAYQEGKYIFTHADLARVAGEINQGRGFVPKGEKIWYQAGSRLRPYGYPFAYVPNIVHQYILVLQKSKADNNKQ